MKIGVGVRLGSSFDGMNLKDNAQKMKVLHRWKEFKDDSEFVKVLNMDDELIELSRNIFGYFPKELINHPLANKYKRKNEKI